MKARMSASFIVIGALLFGMATVFHPPLSNPWDVAFAYHEVAKDHDWIMDHCVFLAGLSLWLIGLAHLSDTERHFSHNGARLLVTSLGMWILILVVELAVLPQMIPLIETDGIAVYKAIWNVWFTWTLFAGYLATGLIYVGLILLSATMDHGWMKKIGGITAAIGVIGIVGSLLYPHAALWIQLSTAPLPYLWTYWLAGSLLKKQNG